MSSEWIFSRAVVKKALSQLGKPYIWAGRGDFVVSAGKQVHPATLGCPEFAFDCAGLVGWAAWRSGAQDLRGWWGAQHLATALPPRQPGEPFELAFYGRDMAHVTHVAIHLGGGLVLEAAGGDATTLTYADALRRAARVRIDFDGRVDGLCTRSLEGLKFLTYQPPKGKP